LAEKDEQEGNPHVPPIAGAFQLHGPLSESERKEQERQREEQERHAEDTAFKNRQLVISERQLTTNNRLAIYTFLLVFLGVIGNYVAYVSAAAARKSADAATTAATAALNTLTYMQASGTEASIQADKLITATSNLATAAKTQSGSMQALADRALTQATSTAALAETTNEAFLLSQKARVTVGRKDGVLADIIVPSDSTQNAEIIIYFQNTGRLPAKFIWGTQVPLLQGSGPTGITYAHPFKGFLEPRVRNKKGGGTEQSGESAIIAGDSVFSSTLGTIPAKNVESLRNVGLLILATYEYCDELGTHDSRQFGLRYRGGAPTRSLSFDLAIDMPFFLFPLPKDTADKEYLPPCETMGERKQREKEAAFKK
jgi:hypothetical protein